MTQQAPSNPVPAILLRTRELFILHQTLYVAAKLGVADRLEQGWRSAAELAQEFKVNEDALYRALRLLASQGIFEEDNARSFRNTEISNFLRTGVPGSMRSLFIYWGSDFAYPPFGQIMHSIETGEPSRTFLSGVDGFEHLRRNPELARVFDNAMTNMSQLSGPAIAAAYDFGAWGSLMDVGGGNGILLSHILRAHPGLRGVLADQDQVLDHAREHGYLNGDLRTRSTMEACNFFEHVPPGCRAYLMKNVIHDWDDEQSRTILGNCRKAIPNDGVLLLAEWDLFGENVPANGKFIDVAMLLLTGGRERSVDEYRELLASTGFRLNKAFPTAAQFAVIEAFPV
ncbi:MAG: tcmN [Edaphobacter sp.]|nr:tcmN [Edaphobacter sp.]